MNLNEITSAFWKFLKAIGIILGIIASIWTLYTLYPSLNLHNIHFSFYHTLLVAALSFIIGCALMIFIIFHFFTENGRFFSYSDKRNMDKLRDRLKSRNSAIRDSASEIAVHLGDKALHILDEFAGKRNTDNAVSAYRIMGELKRDKSILTLAGGMNTHCDSSKLSHRRADAAASALQGYPDNKRCEALVLLKSREYTILEDHLGIAIKGIVTNDFIELVYNLYEYNLVWKEHGELNKYSFIINYGGTNASYEVINSLSPARITKEFNVIRQIVPYINDEQWQIIRSNFLDQSSILYALDNERRELKRIYDETNADI